MHDFMHDFLALEDSESSEDDGNNFEILLNFDSRIEVEYFR